MRHLPTALIHQLLDLLFPDRCAGCGGGGGLFCDRCAASLAPYPAEAPPAGLDGAAVGWIYSRPLQQAIHRLKYLRVRRVAVPLGDLLARQVCGALPAVDALIAVPLHPERLAERGFNQSAELGRRLARATGAPLLRGGLERTRDTGHQARLSRSERQSNMAGAFIWRAPTPPPRRALLVDDVLTTGATLAACAEALRAAGSREIYAVALARSLAPAAQGRRKVLPVVPGASPLMAEG